MALTGVVVDGKVVFDTSVPPPDGTPVRVELTGLPRAAPGRPTRTLLERMGDVVGKAEGLPEDAARNVDHYLYGHPKR